MRADQSGPNNNAWKGGRRIASNGYVMIRVGKGHHLANAQGYAYEHRIVAEKKLGRRLRKRELVHHEIKNGKANKTDNRPSKLKVFPSIKRHAHEHHPLTRHRKPGERNPFILCACGCRQRLRKFDAWNRPRSIIRGHNGHKQLSEL